MVERMIPILRDETGTTMIEYGILAGFITIVALASVRVFGQAVLALFNADAAIL